jgi:hypothetical protein
VAVVFLTGWEFGFMDATADDPPTGATPLVSTVTGAPTITTTNPRTGTYALEVSPVAAAVSNRFGYAAGVKTAGTRFAVMFPVALPVALIYLSVFSNAAGNGILQFTAAGRFQVIVASGAGAVTIGPTTVNTGQWYLVELKYDTTGSTFTLTGRIDEGTEGSATKTGQTATDTTGIYVGTTAAQTYTARYDDWIVLDTATYPGQGQIALCKPNADGAHSISAGGFRDQVPTSITNGTTDAWQRIDGIPMNTTTPYIEQPTAASGEYVEVEFESTPSAIATLNGVRAEAALFADGTGALSAKTSIFNGAAETVVFSGDHSDVTLKYASGIVTATAAEVAALKGRIGFGSAQPAAPRWAGLILEVDYVPLTAPTPTRVAAAATMGVPTIATDVALTPTTVAAATTMGAPTLVVEVGVDVEDAGVDMVATVSIDQPALQIVPAQQFLRPDADIQADGWTTDAGGTTNLWDAINEVSANDADYVQSAVSPTNDELIVTLTDVPDPHAGDGHNVNFRYRKV